MQKVNQNIGKYVALVTALLVVIVAAVFIILMPKRQNPSAIMEMNVNPNVQFLLDQNNKVMQVNYLNDDAQTLLKNTSFKGKTAQQAAQLFVKLSTEAGYIEVSTSGTRVEVYLSCDNVQTYQNLKENIVNKINKYFDNNGIIAGAVVEISNDIKTASQKIGLTAKETLNKTSQELLTLYNQTSQKLKNVALCYHSELLQYIEDLKNTTFKSLTELEENIENLNEQIKDSNLNESLKQELQKQLDTIKTEYDKIVEEFNKYIQDKIDELKNKSEEIYNQAHKQLQQHKQNCKHLLEQHKQYFEQHKEDVKTAIEEYRESLLA